MSTCLMPTLFPYLRTDSSLSSMVTGGSQGPGLPQQAAYSITINQSQPVNNR